MTRQFTMATVLRRTPYKMLRWFLPGLGLDLGFDWPNLHAYEVPKVILAYETVPVEERERIEESIRDIFLLADQEGIAALREAARLDKISYWDTIFLPNASAYLQAIWAWTKYRETFEKAKKLLLANRAVYAKKRTGLPAGLPSITDEKLDAIKDKLQAFFSEKQKNKVVCTVEAIQREEARINVFTYSDDIERPILQHDERQNLQPSMIRPVFEVVFSVDGNEGALSVSAKPSIREELEDLFIRTVYGMEPPSVIIPKYKLQMLKDPRLVLATKARDCVTAEVCFLSIKWPGVSSAATFTAYRKGSFVRPVAYLLGQEPRDLKEGTVANAKIRFHFLPNPGRRAGALCVEFTSENNMVIRCKDLHRVEIMEHYLKTWGIK